MTPLPRARYARADGRWFVAKVVRRVKGLAYIRYRDAGRIVRAYVSTAALSPLP